MSKSVKKDIVRTFDKKYLEKYPDKTFNNYQFYAISKAVEDAVHEGCVENAKQEAASTSSYTPLQRLMHDSANEFDQIRERIRAVENRFKELGINDIACNVHIEYIRSAYQNLIQEFDDFYLKSKEIEK